MPDFVLPELPPRVDLETKATLKQAAKAHRYLAELKGVAKTIPNQGILINTLPLLEAKDSSAIENIITTHDELYKEDLFENFVQSSAAKEVQSYAGAIRSGYQSVLERRMLTNNQILEIQALIEHNRAGFRKLPGTALVNDRTGETVYTPPQNGDDIIRLMGNLEKVINEEAFFPIDPLIKIAVIHYQFESIHPFYDGNGRTGRIINILYMILNGLLDIPVLYLSRYIIRTKDEYYRLLQAVRDSEDWEAWILYMLRGVEVTSQDTIRIIGAIRSLMKDYKTVIRDKHPKLYSQDLLNDLFRHPYTKIEFLERDLSITRQTAAKYLDELADAGLLKKEKIGKYNFYVNEPLFSLFLDH
jgi:Fic family protein